MRIMTNRIGPALVLIIAVGVICYANALPNDFVWDDGQLIKDNPFITSFKYIGKIFTTDLHHFSFEGSNFYRPLQTISYLIDYKVWRLNPFGYHLTNVLIHLGNAVLLYFLIRWLFTPALAFITSLLFVASPLNTQAVSYISGRADPLAAFFLLSAFLLYISAEKRRVFYVLSLVSFILALLSKETALVFPLVVLLYEGAFRKKFVPERIKCVLGYGVTALIFIILRLSWLKFDLKVGFLIAEPFMVRFLTLCREVFTYLRLIILPLNLHMQYEVPFVRSIFNPQVFLSVLALAAIFILIFINRQRNKLIFFAGLWFFITLLPVSNLFIPLNAVLAEHWLYLPSIGIFLIIAYFLTSISRRNKALLITHHLSLITILLFYSVTTINRNLDWKDRITLYEATIHSSPGSVRAHYNLANAYDDAGRHEEAVDEYKKTIELEPSYAAAHNNLASTYITLGRYPEAIQEYRRALEIMPDLKESYNNLGFLYHKLGKNDEAINVLEKALQLEPNFAIALNNLGNAYLGKGDIDKARRFWKEALEARPDYSAPAINLKNAENY